jgi:hypothetical protein
MYQNKTTHPTMVSAPVSGQLYQKLRPQKRPVGTVWSRPEKQSKTIPNRIPRPAFLNFPHPPRIARPAAELKCYGRIEKQIKSSLCNLCRLYGLKEPILKGIFPMNVYTAFTQVSTALHQKDEELKLKIMQEASARVCLATQKTFDTRMTLYYLPLCPFWEMMKQKERKKETNLLLSMLAYLFQIAGIPHFAENFSYLGGIYQIVAEWQSEQEEEDEDEELRNESEFIDAHFSYLWEAGAILLALMADPKNLKRFDGRVKRFTPKDAKGDALLACAKALARLYRKFPTRSVIENMGMPAMDNDEDNFIRSEQYLGFYWSNSDCIIDSVMEYVNAELNECCEIEEPPMFVFNSLKQ